MLIRFPTLVFLIAATWIAVPTTHAQLLCYEGFEYKVTAQTPSLWPVTNKSPSDQPLKYFTELDTHAVRAPYQYTIQIVDGSVPTEGSAFPFRTQGNALSWVREWSDVYGTIANNVQIDTSNNNQPLFLSFAMRSSKGANSVRQIAVALSNGSNMRLQAGVDDSSNTGNPRFFACAANPQPNWDFAAQPKFEYDTTYFVVMRIQTFSSRADTVQMVVYGPGGEVAKSERAVKWTAEASAYTDFLATAISFSLYGGEPGGVLIDELRIGSSWESVAVPTEPIETATATSAAGSASSSESADSAADAEEKSSPVVLGMIVLGIIIFFVGGGAFYWFVIKPSAEAKGIAKPKSAPVPPASTLPKEAESSEPKNPATTGETPRPPAAPKPANAPEPPKPSFRQPRKPPPPKPGS